MWDSTLKKWEYESHNHLAFSSYSGSSGAMSDDSLPSLLRPIDDVKVEDHATV